MKKKLAVIILTKNESKHIERCINSIRDVVDDIVVVDSFSTDDTCEKAERLGARVFKNPWKNYATQFNFGVYETGITTDWIWRLDADEYIEGGLGKAVLDYIQTVPDTVNGIYVRRRIDFLGKPLKHGGWYPCWYMKVWRRGHGDCENRWMDEHLRIFDGEAVRVEVGNQVDDNQNDLTWWTDKHNGYATREMIDMLMIEYGLDEKAKEVTPNLFGSEAERKRWLKLRYVKSPLFVRPFINFFIRYILKGGFLDGRHGFIWHILQGFWYRMLVDAKIYEIRRSFDRDDEKIKKYIIDNYINSNCPILTS